MLALQNERYKQGEKHLSRFDMIKLLTPLKKESEYEWLKEVSSVSLQTCCSDLSESFSRFFKKTAGYPKFKSKKKAKASYSLRCDGLYFDDGVAHIAKLGKVKYKTSYNIPIGKQQKFYNPRVSLVNNKWILSFNMECENQTPALTDSPMGIDLGIKETATVAFNDEYLCFHNINKSRLVRRLERKLKHLQRNVARKYRTNGSFQKTSNVIKAENKVRRLQYHLANIRLNYTHQMTHELVSKLPCRVVMEDLNVSGMMKNKHLSKAIAQQTFYEFIRQMKYKCEWSGVQFLQVDRFYPSSKTCSKCGSIKTDLKLSDRTFICPDCGFEIDRDYNAAINLMRYAG